MRCKGSAFISFRQMFCDYFSAIFWQGVFPNRHFDDAQPPIAHLRWPTVIVSVSNAVCLYTH